MVILARTPSLGSGYRATSWFQEKMLREIKSTFDKGKITIPFPRYDVEHLST